MVTAPFAERRKDRLEAEAECRCAVFDTRRHFAKDFAMHDAVLLHLAQLLDQHLLADVRQKALQLRQAQGSTEQMIEGDRFPPPRNHFQRALGRQ